jgi:hypothetical protein
VKNIIISLRIKKKFGLSKALMKSEVVHSQNKHNHDDQINLGREVCKYCCFNLHKNINSSTHHIRYLAV